MTSPPLLPGLPGPVFKTYRGDTHRLIPPEETIQRYRPLLPQLGITRIANVTGLDRIGIPVVMVCRPNSRSLAVSQGKGLSLAAAKASGLMEAIESYHAERITLPLKLGSHAELSAEHLLVEPDELAQPKVSLYHADWPLLWVEGHDLLEQERVWVPYQMVHTNYVHPAPSDSGCFAMTSNGLASGNHLLEAISHGISEVVERDSTTLWGLAGPAVRDPARLDLSSVTDPGCQEVLEKCAGADIDVAAWETTSNVGIPAFLCWIRERGGGLRPAAGFGCHPARRIALLRALTEAIQVRLTDVAGSRDDIARSDYEQGFRSRGLWPEQPGFGVQEGGRNFSQVPNQDVDTFDADVRWQLERLRSVGVKRVVVVDLTRSDLGIPVVRVIIPGLEVACLDPGHCALGRRARAIIQRRS